MDSDSQDGQHWMENLDAKLIASFEAMGEDFSWEDISWSHRGRSVGFGVWLQQVLVVESHSWFMVGLRR